MGQREIRSNLWRRDGTVAREVRIPDSTLWSGYEDNLIFAFDSRLGITLETGVSTWADQSGNGNHISQATASLQPAYVEDGTRPYLSPDGTDILSGTLTGWAADQSFTVFVAWALDPPAQVGGAVMFETFDSGSGSLLSGASIYDQAFVTPNRNMFYRNVQTWTSPTHQIVHDALDGSNRTMLATMKYDGTTTTAYFDGTSVGSASTALTVPAPDTLEVCSSTAVAQGVDGRFYCLFAIDSALADADRETIEDRIKTWLEIA